MQYSIFVRTDAWQLESTWYFAFSFRIFIWKWTRKCFIWPILYILKLCSYSNKHINGTTLISPPHQFIQFIRRYTILLIEPALIEHTWKNIKSEEPFLFAKSGTGATADWLSVWKFNRFFFSKHIEQQVEKSLMYMLSFSTVQLNMTSINENCERASVFGRKEEMKCDTEVGPMIYGALFIYMWMIACVCVLIAHTNTLYPLSCDFMLFDSFIHPSAFTVFFFIFSRIASNAEEAELLSSLLMWAIMLRNTLKHSQLGTYIWNTIIADDLSPTPGRYSVCIWIQSSFVEKVHHIR